jgi:hypothetical protein
MLISRVSGLTAEYFSAVPGQISTVWTEVRSVRYPQRPIRQGEEEFFEFPVTVEPRRDENGHVIVHSYPATVERLMVHATAGEAVRDCIGPTRLYPPDVRGFQPEIEVVELDAESAESAGMAPRRQDRVAEPGIPNTRTICSLENQANFVGDRLVQRHRKVSDE